MRQKIKSETPVHLLQHVCEKELMLPFHLGTLNELELVELRRSWVVHLEPDQLSKFEANYQHGAFAYLVDDFDEQVSKDNNNYTTGRFTGRLMFLFISPMELDDAGKLDYFAKGRQISLKLFDWLPGIPTGVRPTMRVQPIYTEANARYSGAMATITFTQDIYAC